MHLYCDGHFRRRHRSSRSETSAVHTASLIQFIQRYSWGNRVETQTLLKELRIGRRDITPETLFSLGAAGSVGVMVIGREKRFRHVN
jgi:hypothetical protein